MGWIEGPSFAVVRVMELDCRYSSISDADGLEVVIEIGVELEGSPTVISVSGAGSSVFLRFFSFLDGLSTEASSYFLRFFLRSGSLETGVFGNVSLRLLNNHVEKYGPIGSAGGSSTCMCSSRILGSDLGLSFFFFLGISVTISHILVNVCLRWRRSIAHLGYLPLVTQYPFSSSSSPSSSPWPLGSGHRLVLW